MEVGTLVAGRYRIVEAIGRGGMGIVFRVEHVHTGERLALKLLSGHAKFDPQALSRFKREARASARIKSEHVVKITDADTAPELENSPFIVMELLDGTDLEKLAQRRGPLEPELVVSLLAQVGRALATAHRLGIGHRDLKPENLFLHQREDGTAIAKVLDFGISKFTNAETSTEAAQLTSTGSVIGTPLYMSPEQAHGLNDKIDPSTDIWAVGLVAMRLLAGESYWGTPTMADLMMQLAVKPIAPPSERWPGRKHMSPALDAWFLRSCDRDQTKRWSSIETQIDELAKALEVEIPTALARTSDPSLLMADRARNAKSDHSVPPMSASQEEQLANATTADSGARADAPATSTLAQSASESTALTTSHRDESVRRTSRWPLAALPVVAIAGIAFAALRTPPSTTSDVRPSISSPVVPSTLPSASDSIPVPPPATSATSAPIVSASVALASSSRPAPPAVIATHGRSAVDARAPAPPAAASASGAVWNER